jgi:hypothetical protein
MINIILDVELTIIGMLYCDNAGNLLCRLGFLEFGSDGIIHKILDS